MDDEDSNNPFSFSMFLKKKGQSDADEEEISVAEGNLCIVFHCCNFKILININQNELHHKEQKKRGEEALLSLGGVMLNNLVHIKRKFVDLGCWGNSLFYIDCIHSL